MKLRHALTLTAVALIASTLNVAFASPGGNLNETLAKTFLDGQPLERHAGKILVDVDRKLMHLDVFEDPCGTMTAPPGVNTCLALPSRVEQVTVPLESVHVDCGSVIYRSVMDGTPRDRPYRELEVIDHSARVCRDAVRSVLEVNAYLVNVRAHEIKTYLLLK